MSRKNYRSIFFVSMFFLLIFLIPISNKLVWACDSCSGHSVGESWKSGGKTYCCKACSGCGSCCLPDGSEDTTCIGVPHKYTTECGGDDDDDTGPVCGNLVCETGESEQNCCYDCGTPCDGTATNQRGSSTLGCGSCPGGSCFCDQLPGQAPTRGGCNSASFSILFPDGTTMMATYAELEELEQSGQEFEITERPAQWATTSIVCPAAYADDQKGPIEGAVDTGETKEEDTYKTSGNFWIDITSKEFHFAFTRKAWTIIQDNSSGIVLVAALVLLGCLILFNRRLKALIWKRGHV